MTLLLIGAGGFVGATARLWVNHAIFRWFSPRLPWATFLVNISGSFVLGLLAGLSRHGAVLPQEWLIAASTGFLGAYTTFSTWNLETVRLANRSLGLLNLLLSTLVGLVAAMAGISLGLVL